MTSRARSILVAEADPVLRSAAETTFLLHGFTVLTAADGEEALRLARAEGPDLILLDLVMPNLPSIEVLRALRQDPSTSPIPVIAFGNLKRDACSRHTAADAAGGYLLKVHRALQDLVRQAEQMLAARGV